MYGTGHAAACNAAECVATVRAMLDMAQWRPLAVAAVETALENVVPFLNAADATAAADPTAVAAIGEAAAALSVLGGHTETLRVGVRVCPRDALAAGSNPDAISGTAVRLESSTGRVHVVFDPMLPPVDLPATELVAMDQPPLRQAIKSLGGGAMTALLAVLKHTAHVPMPDEDGGASGGGGKKAKRKKESSSKAPAGGEDQAVTDHVMWMCQLKARAFKAVSRLATHPEFTEEAVRAGLFHTVLQTSLLAVELPTLVQSRCVPVCVLPPLVLRYPRRMTLIWWRRVCALAASVSQVPGRTPGAAAGATGGVGRRHPCRWCRRAQGLRRGADAG